MIELNLLLPKKQTIDVQYFYESGTWVKPEGTHENSLVEVFMWGAGAGGRAVSSDNSGSLTSGGCPGEFRSFMIRAGELTSEEPVIIGAGGAGGSLSTGSGSFRASEGASGGITEFFGVECEGGTRTTTPDSQAESNSIGDFNLPLRPEFLRGLSTKAGKSVTDSSLDKNSIIAGAAGGGGHAAFGATSSMGGICYGFMNRTNYDPDNTNPPLFGPGNGGAHAGSGLSVGTNGGRASGGGGAAAFPGSAASQAGNGGDGIVLIITRI